MKILFLTLNPGLQGPLPKHNPLLIAALEKLGCKTERITWGRHSEDESIIEKIFGRLEDIGKAITKLAKTKPDIMYVATTLDERALVRDVFLLLAARWSRAAKVLKMHGSKTTLLTESGHYIYKYMTKLLIRLSDAILLLSNDELLIWRHFEPRGKYYRVDNPFVPLNAAEVDTKLHDADCRSVNPKLLFVGRLIKAKGIFDLLHALPIVLQHVDCHLLIAGDGEEIEEIRRWIQEARLENSVTLLGYVKAELLSDCYRSSSVFVLPTYFGEGFPTAITEAMSFGLPIITTPIRGARDHLQDGINGLFVQPRSPDTVAQAVLRLLRNPELCLKMGHENLTRVREFAPENVAPRYNQIFGEILEKDGLKK